MRSLRGCSPWGPALAPYSGGVNAAVGLVGVTALPPPPHLTASCARREGVRPEPAVRRAEPRHQEGLHPSAHLQGNTVHPSCGAPGAAWRWGFAPLLAGVWGGGVSHLKGDAWGGSSWCDPPPFTPQIHSVHQRREVQGRAKDFDVLVAELKASSRREAPKEKSPPRKDPPGSEPPAPPALPQPPTAPPGSSPCRPRPPHVHCPPPR